MPFCIDRTGCATLTGMRRLLLASLVCSSACISLDDFPSESIIAGPRIIAVVVDPPEVTPGSGLSVSALVVDADEVEIEYRICGTFDGPFGGAQFGERDQEECGSGVLLRGTGATWSLPAEVLQTFWDNADLVQTILGGALSAETIATIRTEVGVPLLVDITVKADGRELRATKRVLLSENIAPHTNPPPPELKYGRHEVRGAA